ncbi:retinol-binding protein pinta-like [Musca vetustissima]|uniref:retinol-binding protein pinta-like n=1 Tax=Musca vetustissima TaxID=27455 RepID=UPI002AB6C52C|nr:retinol-binding protein pinta-like [Musca vetustissima]
MIPASLPNIQPLSEDLQKVAIEELGEVPSRIPEDLLALKTWISQQPHLKARTDDQWLIQYLRGCKYSLERAKEKLDFFYTITSKYPELFTCDDLDNPRFREVHNEGIFLPLPKLLHDSGPRMVFFRMKFDIEKYKIEDVMRPCNIMHQIMLLNDPPTCINGLFYVADFGGSAGHFLQFTPSIIKRQVAYFEKALPLRIKAWCFFNVSAVAEQFFKIILPLVSEKLRKRIHIYNKDSLHKLWELVPQKYMPAEYGGENGSLAQAAADYHKVWDEYRDYFKENSQYGVDENLRPGNPMDFDSMFGLCGSFRKIEVD